MMKLAKIITIFVLITTVFAQATCVLSSSNYGATLFGINFFAGVANVAGFPISNPIDVQVVQPGDIASHGLIGCGLILVVPYSDTFFYSPEDVDTLKTFHDAGGIILFNCGPGTPNCYPIINSIVSSIDSTTTVQFSIPAEILSNNYCSAPDPATSAGMSSSLLTTPNDMTTSYYTAGTTSFNIPDTDPQCLAAVGSSCILAASTSEKLLFLGDYYAVLIAGGNGCDGNFAYKFGENVGNLVTINGGAGGDPHIFSFDGKSLEFKFENKRKYLFYSSDNFRIAIGIAGSKEQFISEIGISIGENRLYAGRNESSGGVGFFWNEEQIVDSVSTILGEATVFTPDPTSLDNILGQLSSFLFTGIKINNYFEIVGGLAPNFGKLIKGIPEKEIEKSIFFNLEVFHNHRSSFGLLPALSNKHTRNSFELADFEIPELF